MANVGVDPDAQDVQDELDFQSRFPASTPGSSSAVSAGEGGGDQKFSDWWGSDSTQEKFQGLVGSIGAVFGGLAGLPLGGGDTSSLERGAVRAANAYPEARQRIQQHRFTEYIDKQLAEERDPQRRDMLEAARAYPQQAAQYLAMERPESKLYRSQRIEELKHGYRMQEIEARNQGKGGVSRTRLDQIESANAYRRSLSPELRQALDEGNYDELIWEDPRLLNFLPLLFSPSGGDLYRSPDDIRVDTDQPIRTREGDSISLKEYVTSWLADKWDTLTEETKNFWELILTQGEAGDGELSPEAQSVADQLGLGKP